MIKKTTKLFALLMLLVVFQFTSCQKEEVVLIEENPEEGTITNDSSLTLLMLRTSLNDGNNDDFIDGADCFSIAFPFTLMIGDTEFIIENELDYQEVLDFIEASGGTLNDIEIVFPINIVFLNYDEVVVNNQQELNNYIAACEDEIIDDIDCIDFIYPISFFVYNSETEITTTVTVFNDSELFLFLSTLSNTDFISIDFPISVELGDGSIVEVNSNQELEDLINSCEDSGNTDVSDLEEYLTTDTWFVDYFFAETDETSNYCEYGFYFESNGTVSANNGTNFVNGTWNVILDNNELKVVFDFGNEIPFDELNEDWKVLTATINEIELEDISDGNEGTDLLTFNREITNCEGGNNSELEGYLTTDSWFITYYFDEVDETSDFCEYELIFNVDGFLIASNGTDNVNGAWSVIADNGIEKLVFDFGSETPFDELNDDWDVINASNLIIELQDVSGGNGETNYLTLDRTPTICEDENTYLEQVLLDGEWLVASYLHDGENETSDYDGYIIEFFNEGIVKVNYNNNLFYGTWDVNGNTNNLSLVLDFENEFPFDEFNDDWDVLDVQENRVELEDVSGGGGGTDTLVFEKI